MLHPHMLMSVMAGVTLQLGTLKAIASVFDLIRIPEHYDNVQVENASIIYTDPVTCFIDYCNCFINVVL